MLSECLLALCCVLLWYCFYFLKRDMHYWFILFDLKAYGEWYLYRHLIPAIWDVLLKSSKRRHKQTSEIHNRVHCNIYGKLQIMVDTRFYNLNVNHGVSKRNDEKHRTSFVGRSEVHNCNVSRYSYLYWCVDA